MFLLFLLKMLVYNFLRFPTARVLGAAMSIREA